MEASFANAKYADTIPQLESTFKQLHEVLSALTEKQLNQIPFEGSWTAAQVGDHLLRSYGVAETLNGNTAKTERPVEANVQGLKDVFLNFETKLQSPEFILPSNEPINKNELLDQLEDKTAGILQTLNSTDLTETCLDFEMPGIGLMTRLEWAHFVLYHTQRHINQLKKISSVMSK